MAGDFLELEGRVSRIVAPDFVVAVGQQSNFKGESAVVPPELRRGFGFHARLSGQSRSSALL